MSEMTDDTLAEPRSLWELIFGRRRVVEVEPKCRHQWRLLDKTIFKGEFELMLADGRGCEKRGPWDPGKVILSFACDRCGKLLVESRQQ